MAARLTAVDTIIAVDSNRDRLDMALELGATLAFQAGPETSVDSVVCRCGFKTFNPVSPCVRGVKVTSCPQLCGATKRGRSDHRHAAIRVGEFGVARSGDRTAN